MDNKVISRVYILGGNPLLPVKEVGYHDFTGMAGMKVSRTQNFCTVHFVLSGKGVYQIGGNSYNISAQSVFFAPEGEVFSYYPDEADPWTYVWFVMSAGMEGDILRSVGLSNAQPVRKIKAFDGIKNILKKLIMHTPESAVPYRASAAFFGVLADLAIEYGTDNKAFAVNLPEYYVNKAIGLIEANYTRFEFGVLPLCKIMNISHSYLSRLFKRVTDTTLSDYIINIRYNHAARLLTTTPMTVSEVSYNSGIKDEVHFHKQFKKIYGVTAGQYRKNCAK